MADEAKWYEGLDESVTSNNMVTEAPDMATFVKSALDNQAYIGGSIRIPGEDSGEEDISAFVEKLKAVPGVYRMPGEDDSEAIADLYSKLGKPADAADYGIDAIDGLEADQLTRMMEAGLDANMTKTQMGAMVKMINDVNSDEAEARSVGVKAGREDLINEWGLTSKERTAQAEAVFKAHFSFLGKSMDSLNADTVRALADIGKALGSEGTTISNDHEGQQTGDILPPEEAKLQVSEIMSNRDHPYWKPGDPAHAAAKKKVLRLMAMANPKASTTMDSLRASAALPELQQLG